MGTGADPKVDYAFKKVFGREANISVLLDLIEAVLAGQLTLVRGSS
jgi:hypothetical protein